MAQNHSIFKKASPEDMAMRYHALGWTGYRLKKVREEVGAMLLHLKIGLLIRLLGFRLALDFINPLTH